MAEEERPKSEEAIEVAAEGVPEEDSGGYAIGDKVVILGGKYNGTIGKFYGFFPDRLYIQPIGLTNEVIRIPLIDGAPDPELEIEDLPIYEKAAKPGFLTMIDVAAGDFLEAFDAEGEPVGVFEVEELDEDKQLIRFKDERDFIDVSTGIKPEYGYEVLRVRKPPAAEGAAPVAESEAAPEGPVSRVAVEEDDALEDGVLPSREEDEELEAAAAAAPKPAFRIGRVLELAIEEDELQEEKRADQIIPDVFQRQEMLAQRIRSLPAGQQRNPTKLQEVRREVELLMILRNFVVKYGVTGDPMGLEKTSYATLQDILKKPNVPLARKVAEVAKVIICDHSPEHISGDDRDPFPGPIEDGIYADYLTDILQKAKMIDESQQDDLGGEQQPGAGMPRFYLELERYRQQVQTPYVFEGTSGEPVETDEEVFQKEIPDFEEPTVNALVPQPYDREAKRHPKIFNPPPLTQIPVSVVRALKQKIGRFSLGERYRVIEPADAVTYTNVLVLPLSELKMFGPVRSGKLSLDVALGLGRSKLYEDILSELDINDFPTSDSILNLGVRGSVVGNVAIKDWLESLDLKLTGPGDVFDMLRAYGNENIELSLEQTSVVQDKVLKYLAALKLFMIKQREENRVALENLRFEPQGLLSDEDATRLVARIESEPLLQNYLAEIREQMGDLANVDINWFAYLVVNVPDLLIAILGQQPTIVTRERLRKVRDQFIASMTMGYRMRQKIRLTGELPEQNACTHVKDLLKIRKISAKEAGDDPRDVKKIKNLVELLNKYRGKTEDNWVWCKVCNEHLLCAHELIHIQEYLRPAEEETLHKEMLINFSGGTFGGQYICKVCGQSIANLEFDTNIEFDDEGRPMMGRSVMVDREAIETDEIEELLKGPANVIEELDFGGDELNTMYKTLKKLCNLMGINPDENDYKSMVEHFSTYVNTLTTREAYAEEAKGRKVIDYDIYFSIRYVAAAAAVALLSAQTRIPDYTVYYTTADCKNGFFGFPLEDEENTNGLVCMASIVAGINDNEFPWNQTTLQRKSNLLIRRDAVMPLIKEQLAAFASDPILQTLLAKKRDYRTRLFGKIGGAKADQIASTFRPVPYIVTEEEAATEDVVPEAAEPELQATAWIRTAHKIARKTAALNPDAPTSTTICCLTPVHTPGAFWNGQNLPALEPKILEIGGGARTEATFHTNPMRTLEGKVDPKEYYKLFVHVCYQGDRKGLPHKLGLSLVCEDCGLGFKENPNLPLTLSVDDKEAAKEKVAAEAELLGHIQSQGVVINEETFNDLLTEAHKKASFSGAALPTLPRIEETLPTLATLEPAPLENWAEILNATAVALQELGPGATRIQIATAAETLVAAIDTKEQFIKERLGDELFAHLQSITRKTPRECGETLMNYFLIPFQRRLTQNVNFQILDTYDLSAETKEDILQKGILPMVKLTPQEPLAGITLKKVKQAVQDFSAVCNNVFPYLRTVLMPGGSFVMSYILRAYVMGLVARFMDPHQIPAIEEASEALGGPNKNNFRLLYASLAELLTRYAVGTRIPSEEEIRLALEKRAEKEREQFQVELNGLSRDRRKVEMELKKRGMGKWSVGGSKAIRQYDADRYEAERVERAMAGIMDYPEMAGADQAEQRGRAYDMFGADFGPEYDAEERVEGRAATGMAEGEDE